MNLFTPLEYQGSAQGGIVDSMPQRQFLPDSLTIPYQLIADDRLDSLDEKVYAVLYWLEHIRGGPCDPSNEELARLVHSKKDESYRSVQNSLLRLEELGYILREYKDPSKRHRSAIKTNISFKSQTSIKGFEAPMETPGEFARRFFAADPEAIGEIGKEVVDKTGIDRIALMRQIKMFVAYWTEPTKSGKKQRWETEKTFEIKRRLATWLTRAATSAPKRKGLVT